MKGPINAHCANVGPASKDSKVNNIALKMAALGLRFSLEIGSTYRAAHLIYKVYHENSGHWTDRVAHYARYFV